MLLKHTEMTSLKKKALLKQTMLQLIFSYLQRLLYFFLQYIQIF